MKRGFTLIELVTSLAIIAILAAVVIMKIPSLDGMKEKEEVRQIERNLNYARRLAIASGRDVNFYLDEESYSYQDPSTKEETKVDLEYLTLQVMLADSKKPIAFKENGSINNAGSIKILGNDKNYKITIVPVTGKINVKEGEE